MGLLPPHPFPSLHTARLIQTLEAYGPKATAASKKKRKIEASAGFFDLGFVSLRATQSRACTLLLKSICPA